MELDERVLHPAPEEKLFIPRETVHRLSCVGERSVRILEISFGEFDEEDIVRLEDIYGRVGAVENAVGYTGVQLVPNERL